MHDWSPRVAKGLSRNAGSCQGNVKRSLIEPRWLEVGRLLVRVMKQVLISRR